MRVPMVVVVATLAWGCAPEPTAPLKVDVQFGVSALPAEGRPSQPIAIEAKAVNAGTARVYHCQGCGCGNGVEITVYGPDGDWVALTDPKAPVPACADGYVPFEPATAVTREQPFTGKLFQKNSPIFPTPTYDAPPGRYRVVAKFGYALDAQGNETRVERSVSFEWHQTPISGAQ
jgi:hypothetical protein